MRLPVTLQLQPSRSLALLLLAAHCGALAVCGGVVLPIWIKLPLALGILISFWRSQRRLYGAQRIVLLTLRDEGVLEYVRFSEEIGEARVHPQSMVTPLLAALLLRRERRMEALVLLPDSLEDGDFRRLRLWLRWQAAPN